MDIYREHILDHYRQPRNYGKLAKPDLTADQTNPLCGDHLHFELAVSDGRVTEVKFTGGGCAISLAAASILTEMTDGRSVTAVSKLSDQDMLRELGVPLSPSRLKCGLLALTGVRKALKGVS